MPKKADAKSPPKGKSKGYGKPLNAEEKAKTPCICIFHQMPSGCVHGAKSAYSHSKAPPPSPKGEGNADPKPKPKTAPAAAAKTLATVAILAATVLQPSQAGLIERAADSGAGRHLTSFEALGDQGYDRSFFDGFSNQSHESLRFSTGGGQKDSSFSIGFQDRNCMFGKASHFILDSCPMVRSTIGLDVEQNGLVFIRLPGCKPYYVSCSEENKFYASRISQNVPFFQSNFEGIPGVPAAVEHPAEDFRVETPPELLEEPVVPDSSVDPAVEPGDLGERSSRAAEVREVAPDEPLPMLSDAVVRARAEAVSIEHRINHFPKHPLCDICNRAKLCSKRIRSHRVPGPESDLPQRSKFGEQVAIDHMVVSKSSGGKEFLVQIVYDSFSGIVNAYPATLKGSDFVYPCLPSFCWPEIQKPSHGLPK